MLNQVVLVGRLNEINQFVNYSIVTLVVPRSFKNENGEYLNDYIKVMFTGNISKNTMEYCKKGDLIGVKGRLQNNDETEYKNEIIAEKVTFLSTKKED